MRVPTPNYLQPIVFIFIESAPGSKWDKGGNLIQKPTPQRLIVFMNLTLGSKWGAGDEITQGPTLYRPKYQRIFYYNYKIIYTGDNGRVSGNIMRAAKELPKVLKNFNKMLTYPTNK